MNDLINQILEFLLVPFLIFGTLAFGWLMIKITRFYDD